MFQVTKKHTNILQSEALQNLPEFDFWFENKTIWQPCIRPRVVEDVI
jgi:hypothetical protein